MASRRRRRKTIGKVVSDVERRVRVVEKRPGAKRIKRNVVTAEKIQYRSIVAKNVATDGITPNEVSFGTPVVSTTEPAEYLKEGTFWFDPDTGSAKVYDLFSEDFIGLADLTARASADGKNTIYRQDNQPTGGTYVTGDTWFDTNDDNKIYRYNGTSWVGFTLGNNALASISAAKITAGSLDAGVIVTSNLDAGQITTGGMSAARITTGTLNAITITSATVTGSTITGGTIRTADSGTRIELTSTNANRLNFYGTASNQGMISVSERVLNVFAPASTLGGGAVFSLYGDESAATPGAAFITAGPTNNLSLAMTSTTISLSQGTYGLSISNARVAVSGAAGESSSALRNVRISQTAPTSGDDSSTYIDGSILLVREA